MGQTASDPYDHYNFLTAPQLEALSKREAKLSLTQRRQRYSCGSKYISASTLRPFDLDNVPAKFDLQRLLQHEYIMGAQIDSIKSKMPKYREQIFKEMRQSFSTFLNSPNLIKELTRLPWAGETVAQSRINMIPMEDGGKLLRSRVEEQLNFLSDDSLFIAYHHCRRNIPLVTKYLFREIYDGIQIQALYLYTLDLLEIEMNKYITNIKALRNLPALSPTHKVAPSVLSPLQPINNKHNAKSTSAETTTTTNNNDGDDFIPLPYIEPPTFSFITRLYFSDSVFDPVELLGHCIKLIYDIFTKSDYQNIITLGRSYCLLRSVLWKPPAAAPFYLKDVHYYAILAPKLISKYHENYPQDLPVKFVHDCLKRTDFNLVEAEELYDREITRRKRAVQTFKQSISSRGGMCTVSERIIINYLDQALWDNSIAFERYDYKELLRLEKEAEIDLKQRQNASKKNDDNNNNNSTNSNTNNNNNNNNESGNIIDLAPTTNQAIPPKSLFSLSALSPEHSKTNIVVYGEDTGITLAVDMSEWLDKKHQITYVDPLTIRSLGQNEQRLALHRESSRCVSSYLLQAIEKQRLSAHYTVLHDWENRNLPLTTDHPWMMALKTTTTALSGEEEVSKVTKAISHRLTTQQNSVFQDVTTRDSKNNIDNTIIQQITTINDDDVDVDDDYNNCDNFVVMANSEGDDNNNKKNKKNNKRQQQANQTNTTSTAVVSTTIPTTTTVTNSKNSSPVAVVKQTNDKSSNILPIYKNSISELIQDSIAYEPNTEITKLFSLSGNKPPSGNTTPSLYHQKHKQKVISPLIESDLTVLWVLPDRTSTTPTQRLFQQYGGKRYQQEYLSRFTAKGNPQQGDVMITSGHGSCSKYILHVVVPEQFTTINEIFNVMNITFHAIKNFATLSGDSTTTLRVIQFTSFHNVIQNVPLYLSAHILTSMARQYLDIVANRRVLDKLIICIDDPNIYHIVLRIACLYFPPPGYDSTKIVKMYEYYEIGEKNKNVDHAKYIASITPFDDHFDENLVSWYNEQVANMKRFVL